MNPFEPSTETPRSLNELMNIRGPATYLVRVDGDSMQGAGMFSGDRLVVSKDIDPVRGYVVIGVVNGEHVCKRLDFVGGMPVLRSESAGYADRYVLESGTIEKTDKIVR